MNCSDILKFAPLYLAGELEPSRAEAFSAHLGYCPACSGELGQQAAFDEILQTSMLAEHIDTWSVDQRVRAGIGTERNSRRWLFALAGIAAAILLVIVAGYQAMISFRTKPVYAAAARDHRMEIVDRQPRKWFTDLASIEKLGVRAGLSGFAAASFAPAGYHLAQAKLCLLDGRVFLHLVYAEDSNAGSQNDADDFSLYLRKSDDASYAMAWGLHTGTFAAEHVAGFQHGPLKALIVTEQAGDSVVRLAKTVETAL
jgi:anti-sigma factor RsiW